MECLSADLAEESVMVELLEPVRLLLRRVAAAAFGTGLLVACLTEAELE